LIEHHIERLAARTGKPIRRISQAAMTALYDYDYPGNVRELINILERAFVLCHGERIDMAHLSPEVARPRIAIGTGREFRQKNTQYDCYHADELANSEQAPCAESPPASCPFSRIFTRKFGNFEQGSLSPGSAEFEGTAAVRKLALENMWPEVRSLLEALDAHGWNREDTARALSISRSTLWRRMKQWGLTRS